MADPREAAQEAVADFTRRAQAVGMPEGYELASVARYNEPRPVDAEGKPYTWAVQLLCKLAGDIPRGTGETFEEAVKAACANVMGDDGFSAAFRRILTEGHGHG